MVGMWCVCGSHTHTHTHTHAHTHTHTVGSGSGDAGGSSKSSSSLALQPGDMVEVTEGDLMNLQGKVLSVEMETVTIMPKHDDLKVRHSSILIIFHYNYIHNVKTIPPQASSPVLPFLREGLAGTI